MKPMLDPERDLRGATPEKLARVLLAPSHCWTSIQAGKQSSYH